MTRDEALNLIRAYTDYGGSVDRESLAEALADGGKGEAVAEVVASTMRSSGVHVRLLAPVKPGTMLYTAPQAECAPRADADTVGASEPIDILLDRLKSGEDYTTPLYTETAPHNIYETYTAQNGWLEVTREEYERTNDRYVHRIRLSPTSERADAEKDPALLLLIADDTFAESFATVYHYRCAILAANKE